MSDIPAGTPQPAEIPPELQQNVFMTTLDNVYNWGRARSMWPMMFGLACCAIEMIAVQAARFDLSRFGMEIMRASPRQADLMIVSGTVTKKMVPNIVRLYNQMPEPKYVLAMGACATSGGPFKEGYNVVSGIDKYVPVDVYVPGCPPTPEALLYGLLKVHEKVFKESIRTAPWYKKGQRDEGITVPVLGPDIYNPQQVDLLKAAAAKAKEAAEAKARQGTAAPPAGAAPAAGTRPSPEELERRRAEARARKAAQESGNAPAAPAGGPAPLPPPAPAAPAVGGRLSPEELDRRRAEARARKAAQGGAAGPAPAASGQEPSAGGQAGKEEK
jgi:NADH-quinone oxidoreductase subunit B